MALPRLEVPPDALVLFESVPEGLDRSGGYRFAVIADGRFLHGGNSALQVDPETRDDDDPAQYWTGPMEPVANFDANALADIKRTATEVQKLPPTTRRPPGKESEPTLERVTTTVDGITHTTVGHQRGRPTDVQKLLEAVERAGQNPA